MLVNLRGKRVNFFVCTLEGRAKIIFMKEYRKDACKSYLTLLMLRTLKSDFKSTEVVVLAILLTMINALKISRSLVYLPYRV